MGVVRRAEFVSIWMIMERSHKQRFNHNEDGHDTGVILRTNNREYQQLEMSDILDAVQFVRMMIRDGEIFV